MKKAILVLSAIGGMFYLTSCGGDQSAQDAETTYTQEQLDSIMKVQQDSIAAAQALANDSMLNKMAADSIAAAEAAAAAGRPVPGKTNVRPSTKPSTTKPTAPVEEQKPVVDPGPKKGSNSDRSGATSSNDQPKKNTDRPGAGSSSNDQSKKNSDRPGAN